MNMKKGFTLIELLIVIAVLGILAAGLLAAVDPFEQLKKGRDTSTRNVVVELHNAVIRYFGEHGDSPWFDSSACNSGALSKASVASLSECIKNLEDDGELKEGFIDNLGDVADKIFVTSPTSGSVTVCYSPTSRSQFKDDANKFDQGGVNVASTTCSKSAKEDMTPGDTCFWCAK